jgi:hypothetical protein
MMISLFIDGQRRYRRRLSEEEEGHLARQLARATPRLQAVADTGRRVAVVIERGNLAAIAISLRPRDATSC